MNILDAEFLGLANATSEEISEEKEIKGINFKVTVFSAQIEGRTKYSANFFKDGNVPYLSVNYDDNELTPMSVKSLGNDIPEELGNELLYQGAVSIEKLLLKK